MEEKIENKIENKEENQIENQTENKIEPEEQNFVGCFWNNYENIHKRYIKKFEYFDNIIEIFSKIHDALKYYLKILNAIQSKKYKLFPEEDSTQFKMLNNINKVVVFESSQLSQFLALLKKLFFEQLKKHKYTAKAKEKELYNQLMKMISKYKSSRETMNKNQKKYHQLMKSAESSLRSSKTMKIKNVDTSQENLQMIQKMEGKSKDLLVDSKKIYDKYISNLNDANKNREESIKRQETYFNFVQNLEAEDGKILSQTFNDVIKILKEQNEEKTKMYSEVENSFKEFNLAEDKNNLIKKYSTKDRPDEKIELIQYEPDINFEKASTPEDYKINHEMILEIKKLIPDIMPNFDTEKEKKKQEMRELSKKIFSTNVQFTDEEKKRMLELLKEKSNQEFFLIYLSKQRTGGRYMRSEKLIKDLADILKLILEEAEKVKDYEALRNCMILSQTYYYEQKDEKKEDKKEEKKEEKKDDKKDEQKDEQENVTKVYLFEFIADNKWIRTPELWRGLIQNMIDLEEIKYNKNSSYEKKDDNDPTYIENLKNIAFSQLVPYANNMVEFYLDDRLIIKIIDEFCKKYNIGEELIQPIFGAVKKTPEEVEKIREEIKNNPNLENELLSLEEVKKAHEENKK